MKEKIEAQKAEREKTLENINAELEKNYKSITQLRALAQRTVGAIAQLNQLLEKDEPEPEIAQPTDEVPEKTDAPE